MGPPELRSTDQSSTIRSVEAVNLPSGWETTRGKIKQNNVASNRGDSLYSSHVISRDRKSTRLNSSHEWISYAVFCLKKKTEIRSSRTRCLLTGAARALHQGKRRCARSRQTSCRSGPSTDRRRAATCIK